MPVRDGFRPGYINISYGGKDKFDDVLSRDNHEVVFASSMFLPVGVELQRERHCLCLRLDYLVPEEPSSTTLPEATPQPYPAVLIGKHTGKIMKVVLRLHDPFDTKALVDQIRQAEKVITDCLHQQRQPRSVKRNHEIARSVLQGIIGLLEDGTLDIDSTPKQDCPCPFEAKHTR